MNGWFRLHPDFIAAVRAADECGRAPAGSWEIWADGESKVVRPSSRDYNRVRRWANAIGYAGPILGEAWVAQ